jgi:membrane fusion protein, multidrug efflux system
LVTEIASNAASLKGLNMRKALCTVFLTCALSCPAIAQQQPSTAVPVGVAKAERKPVARAGDYVGRVEAISRVEIRARITGYLEEVLFKEGDLIKEGAPLYRIESFRRRSSKPRARLSGAKPRKF